MLEVQVSLVLSDQEDLEDLVETIVSKKNQDRVDVMCQKKSHLKKM